MKKTEVDLIVINAKVYTVDSNFMIAEAFAVKNGVFEATGSTDSILRYYKSEKIIDLEGKTVYPGFIDAHSHFYGYGLFTQRIDLNGLKSFEEVLQKVAVHAKNNTEGWITGRGWDQNLWKNNEYPDNTELDKLFPDRPVMLTRVDGHAVLVNEAAIRQSGIDLNKYSEFVIKKNGRFTGILLDNAADIIKEAAANPDENYIKQCYKIAEQACFSVGLTSVCDAGLKVKFIKIIDNMHKTGELKMRVYAMFDPDEETIDFIKKNGTIINEKLSARAVKLYADGALGSHGACLLDFYDDEKSKKGSILYPMDFYQMYCQFAYENNMQVCVHAIGDSANRMVLNLFKQYLEPENDRRWRIEHAQVVHPDDLKYFKAYSIIPSVQFVHATSDMEWAGKRLGNERLKTAYAYKTLLEQNCWIPYGTDFPVENINPIYGFFAAVFRKNIDGKPENGFLPENAITRQQALQAMTIWAAKANFEEKIKGSIEKGKLADFVVLDKDILTVAENEVPLTKILQTFLSGEMVFMNKN